MAIVDYGVGGLGLYNLVHRNFPKLPILYFSDSGQIPYGKQTKSQLRRRLEHVFKYLFSQGVERIVVACHSGSSVVLDSDRHVVGIRHATLNAMKKLRPATVAVIGGGRTINSKYYRTQLERRGWRVFQRVAQPLSILVERGELHSPHVHAEVAKIMKPIAACDHILLACTHYPVLSSTIEQYVSPQTKLVDPIEQLYQSILPYLRNHKKETGRIRFVTTGDVAKMRKASAAFGLTSITPTKVFVPN